MTSKERIGDLVDFLSGFAFQSREFNTDGEGLPIVRIRDVVPGRSSTYYRGAFDGRYLIHDGDWLIGMDGEFNLGRWQGGPALLNQRVAKIDRVTDSLDLGYLTHYLPEALKRIEDATPFATVKHLSIKTLRDIKMPLPPLEEQRRIAAILDRADDLLAKSSQSIEHLHRLERAAFVSLFGDPIRNDRDWPSVKFGEVCETRLGKMLDAKQQTGEHLRLYLRNANVQWFRFDLHDVLQMDFDDKSRFVLRLQPGDLLICEGGQPGRAAVWRGELDECYYQKALHRARPDLSRALADFLAHLLWFIVHRGGLKDHVTSATIAHLTGEKLKAMPIILPPLEVQQRFVEQLAQIDRSRAAFDHRVGVLDNAWSSLTERAFAGRL